MQGFLRTSQLCTKNDLMQRCARWRSQVLSPASPIKKTLRKQDFFLVPPANKGSSFELGMPMVWLCVNFINSPAQQIKHIFLREREISWYFWEHFLAFHLPAYKTRKDRQPHKLQSRPTTWRIHFQPLHKKKIQMHLPQYNLFQRSPCPDRNGSAIFPFTNLKS